MISYEQARARVNDAAWLLPVEPVALVKAQGRVLAQDVHSDVDIPPFNKSSMDGYACRSADAFGPLRVLEHIPAGRTPSLPITQGTCSKIMTGAPVPEGADCVLIVEQVEAIDGDSIRFTGTEVKSNICPTGDDVRRGDVVVHAGTRLRPQHLPALASAGCVVPAVYARPRVGILATGDELVPAEEVPGPGQIRNSNSIQLSALADAAGAIASDLGIVGDEKARMRKAWDQALAVHDIVISTGGVSMGDYDLVPEILTDLGFNVHFDRVAIQPGKPILFGTRGKKACFGLSGNPVSSYLQFSLFVAPFIQRLQDSEPRTPSVSLLLGEDLTRRNTLRMGWVPVRIDQTGKVRTVAYHGSAHINALTSADGLIAFPPGVDALRAGDSVHVLLLHR